MGNYIIVICGAGPHDSNRAQDVEQMTDRFVADLQARNHSIADVHIAIGNPKRLQRDLAPVAGAVPPMVDAHEDLEREARAAYERYGAHAKWKTFDGRPMPDWEALTEIVRSHWRAALDFYNVTEQRTEHVQPGPNGELPADMSSGVPSVVGAETTAAQPSVPVEPAPLPPVDEETKP